MKNYKRKTIIRALIIGSFLFLINNKDCCLDQIDNEIKIEINESKEIVKKKEKTRTYKLNTNFIFNEMIRGGSFRININKDRFINDKDIGWSDYLTVSYDYATLCNDYDDLLKEQKRGKEKNLWIVDYHISYKKKPFLDITYSSDRSIKTYSAFLVSGLGKQFSNGLKIEGGLGIKTGKVDFKKEKYNVINALLGYETPNKKSDYKIDAIVKAYLPRKYLTNSSFEGLWMVDGKATIAINKKILGVMPAVGISVRRDYIPVGKNKQLHYEEIIRYNITLGFNFENGGEIKQ